MSFCVNSPKDSCWSQLFLCVIVSGEYQSTMGRRANFHLPPPGWTVTRFERGKRFMRTISSFDVLLGLFWIQAHLEMLQD
jgi:hypothetical protein